MAELLTVENLAALVTLTVMEIVLGIDNIVFIAILAEKLELEKQAKARRIGLFLAMFVRIILLLAITWIMGLKAELFRILGHPFSGRDLIMLFGGGFLIYKATHEIHDKLEGSKETITQPKGTAKFGSIIAQIVALDIVFSLDSVITAVGMVTQDGTAKPQAGAAAGEVAAAGSAAPPPPPMWHSLSIMITAVVVAVIVMLIFAGPIAGFIKRHPTTKMLALSFLLMIGVVLVADGFGQHVEKGYIYAAMAFSVFVELLNLRVTTPAKKPT